MRGRDGATGFLQALDTRRAQNVELYRRHVNPGFADLLHAVGFGRRFVRAQGLELFDETGEAYLDFVSGYGALNLGHNHAAVRGAIVAMLEREVPGFSQVECSLPTALAAERLSGLLPRGLSRVFFCSSGSEAVEAAIKLARAATGRERLLACAGGFHGTTLAALGLTDNPGRRNRFAPFPPGFGRVPFGDLDALYAALCHREVAGFVVEPILGEGGGVVPPADYLPGAKELCRRFGTLLILDEVQTGLGRTGRSFALEHTGVEPDAVTLAKSLGGGLVPVGALVMRDEAFGRAYGSMRTCLDHKTTFSGGPVAMAAVLATIEVLESEGLVENARRQGEYLGARLADLAARHRQVAEVRGMGLLWGVKFTGVTGGRMRRLPLGSLGGATAELFAQHVALSLVESFRIVTQVAANDLSVLKVMPALAIRRDQVDGFVDALDTVLGRGGHATAIAKLAKAFVRFKRDD